MLKLAKLNEIIILGIIGGIENWKTIFLLKHIIMYLEWDYFHTANYQFKGLYGIDENHFGVVLNGRAHYTSFSNFISQSVLFGRNKRLSIGHNTSIF